MRSHARTARLERARLEQLHDRIVGVARAEHGVQLLLRELAHDALRALARREDLEGCVSDRYVLSTTSARGMVLSPLRHETYCTLATGAYRLGVHKHDVLIGRHGVILRVSGQAARTL